MTPRKFLTFLTALAAVTATAGSEHLVKQRAKDIRDQQNERQGVPAESSKPPPAQSPVTQPGPSPYTARPAAAPAVSSQAAGLSRNLETIQKAESATAGQVQDLTRSLTAAARGTPPPSTASIDKLARDLSEALPGANLSSTRASRLAQQLESALNDPLGAKEMEALATQIHDTLRAAGVGRVDAKVVSNDVKSIIAENQRGANH